MPCTYVFIYVCVHTCNYMLIFSEALTNETLSENEVRNINGTDFGMYACVPLL